MMAMPRTKSAAQPGFTGRAGRMFRTRYVLAGFLLLAIALICVPPRWPDGDGGPRMLTDATGYKAAVDALAGTGLLRVRVVPRPRATPLEQIVLAQAALRQNPQMLGDCRTSWERWALSPWHVDQPSRDCATRLELYMRRSFLAEDMRQPAQWEIDDNRVTAIKSNAHILMPAGDPRESWRGRIRYADQGTRDADAARAMLMLVEVGTHQPVFRFIDRRPRLAATIGRVLSGEARGDGASLAISVAPPRREQSIFAPDRILLQRLGRAVLIGLPPDLHGARFYVDGRPWEAMGSEFDNLRYALIRTGQYVTIEGSDGRRVTVQLVETPGSISEVSAGRRIREPSLYDVAQRLEMSGVGGDVMSSIVGTLQLDLQRRLAASMEVGLPRGSAPRISYRGSVLLMDGLTGEIAAAATYPTEPQQLARHDRDNADRTAWLTRNFNFQPLPVGSAAKVPFAAAITQSHPRLLRMRIPARAEFNSVDGQRLPLTLRNNLGAASSSGRIDFNAFIADSNNEYAVTLLRRATRAEFGTHWRSPSSWAANLWRFACIIPFGLAPSDPDLGWRSVSDQCPAHLWREASGDALGPHPVAVHRTQLRMGAVVNDYTDFYLDILGGGRSSWTTANLAQAYARILSGRAVSPNAARVDRPARRDSVSISPETWSAITHGMTDVVRIGTARALGATLGSRNAVPAGVFLYAKTGTSTLIPNREDGRILVLMAVRTRNGQAPRSPGDICALKVLTINLQRDASSALDLAAQLLDPVGGQRYLRWMTQPCPADRAY